LNRQGHDVGSQYRSAIFAVGNQQLEKAQAFLQRLGQSGHYKDPIVTQLQLVTEPESGGQAGITSKTFWPAEAEHDSYFERNPYQGYCMAVVRPKVEKAASLFADRLT
jgi:peptide-methionine (S)-S-oxide reductase